MVHRLIRLGELKSIRIGRCRRVLHESVRELIAKGGTL
jgi:hypothetical protein